MYSCLMLSDSTNRQECEEAVLELVHSDPDIDTISLEDSRPAHDNNNRPGILNSAKKAKFWRVCEVLYFHQRDYYKVTKSLITIIYYKIIKMHLRDKELHAGIFEFIPELLAKISRSSTAKYELDFEKNVIKESILKNFREFLDLDNIKGIVLILGPNLRSIFIVDR